jgi:hypothetical protein
VLKQFLKKEIFTTFLLWSFFSFSLTRLTAVLLFPYSHQMLFFTGAYVFLSFLFFYVCAKRFSYKLSFAAYIFYNVLFSLSIFLLAVGYHRLVMLNNDPFPYRMYIILIFINVVSGAIMFLFTRFKT